MRRGTQAVHPGVEDVAPGGEAQAARVRWASTAEVNRAEKKAGAEAPVVALHGLCGYLPEPWAPTNSG